MINIIPQIAMEMGAKFYKFVEGGGLGGICDNCDGGMKMLCETFLEMSRACLEDMDRKMSEDKVYKKENGLKIHQKGIERTVMLSIGELKYKRTAYRIEGQPGLVYPIDRYVAVDKKEKVSKELSAKAVQSASELSYSKSAEYACMGQVSKQTVKNKVDEIGELALESSHSKKAVKHLDIYADEDHCSVRGKKGYSKKHTGIVPIVVVAEGKKTVNKQNRLINPKYFQGYGMKTDEFWQGIGAFLREEYDLEQEPEIVLHSDGGNWIKGIDNEISGVIHVMDEFHINEHIKKLCAGEIGKRYSGLINEAIRHGNVDTAIELCDVMLDDTPNFEKTESAIKARRKKIQEEKTYLIRNKESIKERKTGEYTGSCTESMVSHITAQRLSRNPMGWSRHGLAKMSMIVTYTQNGQKITAESIGKDKQLAGGKNYRNPPAENVQMYIDYFNRQAEKIGNFDWSIFEKENTTNGRVCFETSLLKSIRNSGFAF